MAYYIVNFEGKKYMSQDLFLALHNTTSFTLPKLGRAKFIFEVAVFGPMNETDEKHMEDMGITPVVQDFDAQVAQFVKADGTEQLLEMREPPGGVIRHRNRDYTKLAHLKHPNRYRLLDRLAVVRVCGRGIYVCLDSKNKDALNPVVITIKK